MIEITEIHVIKCLYIWIPRQTKLRQRLTENVPVPPRTIKRRAQLVWYSERRHSCFHGDIKMSSVSRTINLNKLQLPLLEYFETICDNTGWSNYFLNQIALVNVVKYIHFFPFFCFVKTCNVNRRCPCNSMKNLSCFNRDSNFVKTPFTELTFFFCIEISQY